jgi:hypothetical protein
MAHMRLRKLPIVNYRRTHARSGRFYERELGISASTRCILGRDSTNLEIDVTFLQVSTCLTGLAARVKVIDI